MICGAPAPKIENSAPQISFILLTGASYDPTKQSKCILTSSNQTYLLITTHFSRYRRVFGKLLSDFWSISPKIDDSWPQLSPIFFTRVSYNDINQSKYVLPSSNQTYLLLTTHFSRYRRVFGKLSSVFRAPAQKLTILGPKFRLFCSLELHIIVSTSQNMF